MLGRPTVIAAHSNSSHDVVRWEHDAGVQSEPALLLERAEEFGAHCAEHGFPYFAGIASVYRGSPLSMLGSVDDGLALATDGLVAYRARAFLYVPNFLLLLAHCYHRAGQPKEGLKYLTRPRLHRELAPTYQKDLAELP